MLCLRERATPCRDWQETGQGIPLSQDSAEEGSLTKTRAMPCGSREHEHKCAPYQRGPSIRGQGKMPARTPQKQPEPCSFVPSHSLLLNDPQRGALKSQKERNIASIWTASKPFPPCSFLPPTHTSFSKTFPWDPLPSGFSFPQTAVGTHSREVAWAPPWISKSLSLVQAGSQSHLSPAQTFAECIRASRQAGVLWHLCSCLSLLYFSLRPEHAPHSCSPSKCSLWPSSAFSLHPA